MTNPDFSDSLTWLEQAKTYLQQNQYIDALNCIHQGLALTPRNADAWLQCGNVLQKLGFYGEAITANHNAQRLFGSPEAKLKMIPLESLLAKIQGQPEEQPTQVNTRPAPPPVSSSSAATDYDFWQRRALACTKAKDYDAALAAYDKVLAFKDHHAQAWYQRGLILFHLQRHEDAIASFDQALDRQPDFYQAWNNRASILIQLGNVKEAIHSYEQALRWTDKQLWQAWDDLGMAMLHLQGVDAGIAIWNQGIDALWCDADDYALGCGSLHQRKGDFQAQQAWQDPSPTKMWKAAKLSYLRALDLLDFQTFPQHHLAIWQSLLQVRFHLQETAAVHSMLLEGAIKLQTIKQDVNLSPEQDRQLEDQFAGFQQMQVDWLVQQNQLKEAILWAERCKDRTLGYWRSGPDYDPIQHQYTDLQPLLNPQRAVIYWHLSPAHLYTFILKPNQDPVLFCAHSLEPEADNPGNLDAALIDQHFCLQLWQKNWDKAQHLSQKNHESALGLGADFWLKGQGIQLLTQLKEILAIESLCQDTLSGIQELILVLPGQWRHLPMTALFPEQISITLLPSLHIGLNLLKAKSSPQDHLLTIVPPNGSEDEKDNNLTELEALAIARSYQQHIQLGGLQLTQKTVLAALKVSAGSIHFTGVTATDRSTVPAPAWVLADGHRLTLEDLFELNWQSYATVCLSGGPQNLKPLPGFIPDLETCLLSLGVQHVLKSLWEVNHCSRIMLMTQVHHLLHQNGNPVHALRQAQHWLRNLTYRNAIQWWITVGNTLALDSSQATTLQRIEAELQFAAQEVGQDVCPFSHPWYWVGFTISGNFPEMLVWNEA